MTSSLLPPDKSTRWFDRAPAGFAVVFVLTFLVYLPSLAGGFVWDDAALVLRDPLIRSWRLTSDAFDHFLFLDATGSDFYRPIQRLTYMWDYQWFAFAPWGYHLTSACIHALAAGALFLLVREIIARFCPPNANPKWPALATAILWGIHPLQTSAVAYVSGRADSLAALFCFLGLTFAIRAIGWPLVNWKEFVAGVCFLLAALSKEMGLIGFVLWLVTIVLARAPALRIITAVLISALAVGVYATMRRAAQHVAPPPTAPASLLERPALAAAALGEYAGLVVAPTVLRMERGQQRWPKHEAHDSVFRPPSVIACATGGIAAIAFVFWLVHAIRRRRRAQMLGLVLAGISYLPVSNLLSLNATVAEHWLYLPLAFTLLAASVAAAELLPRWRLEKPAWATAVVVGVVIWGACLAARTWVRQGDWADQLTFLNRTIESGGATARMYINRAHEFARRGDRAAARADYELALKLAPGQPFALLGLASIDYLDENYAGATNHLEAAATEPFYRPAALEALAAIKRAEHSGSGIAEINEAVLLAPDDWLLTRRKIKILVAEGRPNLAVKDLRAFINEHPFRAESWLLLAELIRDGGNLPVAKVALERAAERDVHLKAAEPFGDATPKELHP